MEKVKLEARKVNGKTIRTTNEAEMRPEAAKIGSLWQDFYNSFTETPPPADSYGVYHSYESDFNGPFSLTVGTTDPYEEDGAETVTVPAGIYLKFSVRGECPAAVIEVWQKIWTYFNSPDAPKRSYVTDFEHYISMDEAEIYIGIEE